MADYLEARLHLRLNFALFVFSFCFSFQFFFTSGISSKRSLDMVHSAKLPSAGLLRQTAMLQLRLLRINPHIIARH